MKGFLFRLIRQPSVRFIALGITIGIVCSSLFSYVSYSNSQDASTPTFNRPRDNGSEPLRPITKITKSEEGDVVARQLADKVRVLCWILTGPANHRSKAVHVKRTWGKRCNTVVFMSSIEDPSLPTVALSVGEGRHNLWGKTREAYRYVWDKYRDQADWFMKADDDTYVVLENLRYMLSTYNSSMPIWFGHRLKAYVKRGYFSGGAGYVLSSEALRRFVQEGFNASGLCRSDPGGAEDVEMGKCMENLNVTAVDTRDSSGRNRFFPLQLEGQIFPRRLLADAWYLPMTYYPSKEGLECCSDTAISFHYVKPMEMYVLDYLIYRVHPYGVHHAAPSTPEPPPEEDSTATPWSGNLQVSNSQGNLTTA